MTVTAESFLAAIIDHPDDDLARIIFADWLEEQGDTARAEFIRVQCRIAALKCLCRNADGTWNGACAFCDSNHLRRWERELLDTDGICWLRKANPVLVGEYLLPPGRFDTHGTFRRGFVEAVTLSATDFLSHADALMAAAPITTVTLTDFRPSEHTERRSTTTPGLLRECRFHGRNKWHPLPFVNATTDEYKLAFVAEWPRVKTWHLPEGNA